MEATAVDVDSDLFMSGGGVAWQGMGVSPTVSAGMGLAEGLNKRARVEPRRQRDMAYQRAKREQQRYQRIIEIVG